jgi:preprotein translocase subunit SecG
MDGMIFPLVLSFHILVGLTLIGLVLIQHGKGADMGAAFGSGASGSLFGASGSANFLSRTTAVCAAIFFLTSLSLTYMASTRSTVVSGSVMDVIKNDPVPAVPLRPEAPASAPVDVGSKAKDIPK